MMIIRIFAASAPTKPFNDAQMRGDFLHIYVQSQNTLMERLLRISRNISLSVYMYPFLKTSKESHQSKEAITFRVSQRISIGFINHLLVVL